MEQKHPLRIVVASPGDVQAEWDVMPVLVGEFNGGIAAEHGFRLELFRWDTDAHPRFHPEDAQGQIDTAFHIEECDLLIGVFWKRFGVPVKDTESETEQEFLRAYEAWEQQGHPRIWVYFKQEAFNPQSKEETDQWGEVLEFKQSLPPKGLWWQYSDTAEFKTLMHDCLTQFVSGSERPIPKNVLELIIAELEHNHRMLQDMDPTQVPPALRDEAWQLASDKKLNIPDDLRTQIEAVYRQIGSAKEIHQNIQPTPAGAPPHPDTAKVGGLLEVVKQAAPLIIEGLTLLL